MQLKSSTPVYTLSGSIDENMTERLLQILRRNKNKRVIVYINTEGGDTQQTKEMCNLLEAHGKVTLIAYGACYSSGTLLLCSADKRLSTPSCTFMVHYGEDNNESTSDKKYHENIFKWIKETYLSRLMISKRTLNRWFQYDNYIYPEKAKEINLIDDILEGEIV